VNAPSYSPSAETLAKLTSSDAHASSADARYPKPVCETCENVAVDTPTGSQARHDCMATSIADATSRSDGATLGKVVSDMKLLLELKTTDLDTPRQIFALQEYETNPQYGANTCDLTWQRPTDPVTCDVSEQTQMDQALSFCGQLGQPAITPDARAGGDFVDYCVDAVRGMPGLFDCEGYYDAYTAVMTTLSTTMSAALLPGNARDQALLVKVRSVLTK
jgi:hypothetical protein